MKISFSRYTIIYIVYLKEITLMDPFKKGYVAVFAHSIATRDHISRS